MARLLRLALICVVMMGIAWGGYHVIVRDADRRTIAELRALNTEMEQRLAQRQAMIDRLGRSRRVAHVRVIDQEHGSSAQDVRNTSVLFIELDDHGRELARQTFTIPGDMLYIDAWTVKFEFDRVAQGDPLAGKTLILLRRFYSDRVAPQDGIPIDTPGSVPPGYAASETARFEQVIWKNFWTLADDPVRARAMGVRVAQGEAVYQRVRNGQCYELIVDNAGGMNMTPFTDTSGPASAEKAVTKANG
jgi:hypothetical protein